MTSTNISLEQALDFANYQAAFTQHRTLLKQKFDNDCIVAYNGGLFKITPEWIGGFNPMFKWAVDISGHPIEIIEPYQFLSIAKSAFETALLEYGHAYKELCKQRSVKTLVGL